MYFFHKFILFSQKKYLQISHMSLNQIKFHTFLCIQFKLIHIVINNEDRFIIMQPAAHLSHARCIKSVHISI